MQQQKPTSCFLKPNSTTGSIFSKKAPTDFSTLNVVRKKIGSGKKYLTFCLENNGLPAIASPLWRNFGLFYVLYPDEAQEVGKEKVFLGKPGLCLGQQLDNFLSWS